MAFEGGTIMETETNKFAGVPTTIKFIGAAVLVLAAVATVVVFQMRFGGKGQSHVTTSPTLEKKDQSDGASNERLEAERKKNAIQKQDEESRQQAVREKELAELRRDSELRRQQEQQNAELKFAEERERIRLQQEAQAKQSAEVARAKRDELEATRRAASEAKLKQSRLQSESLIRKTASDITAVDNEYIATSNSLDLARENLAKSNAASVAAFEKAKGAVIAARNQIAFNQKKILELNAQLQTTQRNVKVSKEATTQIQQKQASLQREIASFQSALSKAEADKSALEKDLGKNSPEIARSEQTLSNLLRKRATLVQTADGQLIELERLRREPDYIEMIKVSGDYETEKLISGTRQLLVKDIENVSLKKDRTGGQPAAESVVTSDPSIVVNNAKVTLYTLKSGRKISSVKSMDAGDAISVKTLNGKFESIKKEDIAKEEVLE
ncbi:hypothetical protein QQ056_19500 [Oscillatoria laete-virens NRMC-F 0139]|nr:hypothetical protein [Oscillatoria laete-virens]MDL5055718.1 hypothetical protein [Oscillatoria laete-virens NRMC-F 0139]